MIKGTLSLLMMTMHLGIAQDVMVEEGDNALKVLSKLSSEELRDKAEEGDSDAHSGKLETVTRNTLEGCRGR